MRDYLKHYRVKICVLSPVYIGSGEKIGKKEHIYMPWNHHVIIPNVEKMYMDLQKKGLGKEFADYMMDGRPKEPSLSQRPFSSVSKASSIPFLAPCAVSA